jgi:hypothetical protein
MPVTNAVEKSILLTLGFPSVTPKVDKLSSLVTRYADVSGPIPRDGKWHMLTRTQAGSSRWDVGEDGQLLVVSPAVGLRPVGKGVTLDAPGAGALGCFMGLDEESVPTFAVLLFGACTLEA